MAQLFSPFAFRCIIRPMRKMASFSVLLLHQKSQSRSNTLSLPLKSRTNLFPYDQHKKLFTIQLDQLHRRVIKQSRKLQSNAVIKWFKRICLGLRMFLPSKAAFSHWALWLRYVRATLVVSDVQQLALCTNIMYRHLAVCFELCFTERQRKEKWKQVTNVRRRY